MHSAEIPWKFRNRFRGVSKHHHHHHHHLYIIIIIVVLKNHPRNFHGNSVVILPALRADRNPNTNEENGA